MALSLLLKSEPNWAKIFKGRFGQHLGQRQTATSAPRLEGEEWKTIIYFILVFFFFKQVNYDKFETKMAWYILYDKLKISFLPLLLIRS